LPILSTEFRAAARANARTDDTRASRARAAPPVRTPMALRRIALALATLSLTACVAVPQGDAPAPASPAPAASGGQPGTAQDGTGTTSAQDSGDTTGSDTATTVDPANDLWHHLRQELRLPTHADRPEVRAAMRAYARDRDIGRVFEGRGRTLMPMVVAEARAQGVPVELAFLPFVESKLNPSASNAGNVGMWQFQASTARLMGLQTGPGIDERKDPVRATRAAYTYLRRLQRVFDGDWMLALTAYNIGDGRLKQLMSSSGTRDVWRLPLPAHCRTHMARLAALWEIARDPAAAGVRVPSVGDDLVVERISVERSQSLADIAQSHGVDREELGLLNAHLGGGTVRAGASLWLPRRTAGTPASARRTAAGDTVENRPTDTDTDARDPAGGQRYRVRPGDSLYSIARRFGTTVARLKAENRLDGDRLRVGTELRVPDAAP
jgi:membrane-bound lytic murein transglycosylase D